MELWIGRPERADLVCWAGLVASGLYGLALTPLRPLLIGRSPLLLELVSGSMSAMVTAGAFARVGRAPLALAVLTGLCGSMMFDPLYWWAGRRWGRRVVELFAGPGKRRLRAIARGERMFHRYGPAAIVLGYFLPIPVTLIYAFAGWSGMRLRAFLLLDLIGTLLWVGTLVGLGYGLGATAVRAATTVSHYGLLISLALIAIIVVPQLRRMRRVAPGRLPLADVSDIDVTTQSGAFGDGLATIAADGTVLDTWFPEPRLGEPAETGTRRLSEVEAASVFGTGAVLGPDLARGVEVVAVRVGIGKLSEPPADAHDVYLRLHLLSARLVAPHGLNLDGIFGKLANVVWTSHGPCPVEGFERARIALRARGPVSVDGVDKFPRMTDYVVPPGVRIADASRVRLGAHLASGTTVMHEGFVNFNAGTLGPSMVEGRISAGVVVGADSDVGGGASIMGTLSGGGTETISVGERCLLGANSGIGISLGDDCVVEAGLYVTAGTKVMLPGGEVVKARDLSGRSGLLLRRNSTTGAVEAVPRQGQGIELNAALHAND